MSKRSWRGIALVICIPIIGFYLFTYFTKKAIVMPRKYLLDSVATKEQDGKIINDSFWHTTANITLLNQNGDSTSLYNFKNKVIILDFFFTHCLGPCPIQTQNMHRLQQTFAHYKTDVETIDSSLVQFISITVDPERDSSATLRNYMQRFNINPDNWTFLTGSKRRIYDFALNELKLGLLDNELDTSFVHSTNFVLIDKQHVIRGYYNGIDTIALQQLVKDAGLLIIEKEPHEKTDMQLLIQNNKVTLIVSFTILILFFIFLYNNSKIYENKKKR